MLNSHVFKSQYVFVVQELKQLDFSQCCNGELLTKLDIFFYRVKTEKFPYSILFVVHNNFF